MPRIELKKPEPGFVHTFRKELIAYLKASKIYQRAPKTDYKHGILQVDAPPEFLQSFLDKNPKYNARIVTESKEREQSSQSLVAEKNNNLENRVKELDSEVKRLKAEFEKFDFNNTQEDFNKAQVLLYKHSQVPRFQRIIEKFNEGFSLIADSMTQSDLLKIVMSKDLSFEKSEKYQERAKEFEQAEKLLKLTDGYERFLNVDELNRILAEKEKLKKDYEDAKAETDLIKDNLRDEKVPYLLTLKQDGSNYKITITTPLQVKVKDSPLAINREDYGEFGISFLDYINNILNKMKAKYNAEIGTHNTSGLVSVEFTVKKIVKNPKYILEDIAKEIIEDQKNTLFYSLGIEAHVFSPLSSFVDGYVSGIFKKRLTRRFESSRRAEESLGKEEIKVDFKDYAPIIGYGYKQGLPRDFETKITKKPGHITPKLNVAIVSVLGKKGHKKTPAEIRQALYQFGFEFHTKQEKAELNNALSHLSKRGLLVKEGYLRNVEYSLNQKAFY